jgi:hypothetical protein
VIREITPSERDVRIAWLRSSSEDVARHHLMRREPGGEWRSVIVLPPPAAEHADTTARRGVAYEYTVVAEDSSGLRSVPAAAMQGRVYDTGVRAGVSNLRAAAERGSVRLTWSLPAGAEVASVVVYRGTGGRAAAVHQTLGSAESFEEAAAPGEYAYAVQLFYRDGGRSPVGAPVSVSVRR